MDDMVIIADIARMEWRPIGPGIYARSLHVDPDTGARTALIRMVPAEGYAAPEVPHYHDTFEEIVGLAGRFTFDSQTWLGLGSYVFHPSGTVHGFASDVTEDSVFLSRVGPGHRANLMPDASANAMYSVYAQPSTRNALAIGAPLAEIDVGDTPFFAGAPGARWHVLNSLCDGHEGAALVTLPAGWTSPPQDVDGELQIFVLAGILTAEIGKDAVEVGGAEGGYLLVPPATGLPALRCHEPVQLFIALGHPEPDRAKGTMA